MHTLSATDKSKAYPSQPELDVHAGGGVEVFGFVGVDAFQHHGGVSLLLEVDEISVVAVHLNILSTNMTLSF